MMHCILLKKFRVNSRHLNGSQHRVPHFHTHAQVSQLSNLWITVLHTGAYPGFFLVGTNSKKKFCWGQIQKTVISSPSLLLFSLFLLPWWGQLSLCPHPKYAPGYIYIAYSSTFFADYCDGLDYDDSMQTDENMTAITPPALLDGLTDTEVIN